MKKSLPSAPILKKITMWKEDLEVDRAGKNLSVNLETQNLDGNKDRFQGNTEQIMVIRGDKG